MTVLNHEEFEGAKELAEIGTKIAEANSILIQLESSTEEFLNKRQADVVERIKATLVESSDLIRAIGTNHSALVEYRKQIDGYVEELRYFIECVSRWKAELDTETAATLKDIAEQRTEVTKLLAEERRESIVLQGVRDEIDHKRALLRAETAKIKDEWATLEAAAKEIKSKK